MANDIRGNADGENGENDSYSISGRSSNIPRRKLVQEVEQGKHPNHHTYKRNGKKYVRSNQDWMKKNNVDN